MAQVYLGSLMLVPYNFAPLGYQFCNGQLLSISQNTALFSLLGTTYGGNGTSTFALPNLQGCDAVGAGQSPGLEAYDMGETGGASIVTLTTATVPPHNHSVLGGKLPAELTVPKGNAIAEAASPQPFTTTVSPVTPMNPGSLTPSVGNNQPHSNVMPYLGLQWIIAMQGIYPPRG
jgi:microcystin-dependent protein